MTVPNNHVKSREIGLLISYYVTLSFWACATLDLALISRNVAGQTKKTCVVAINFVLVRIRAATPALNSLPMHAPRLVTVEALIGRLTLFSMVYIYIVGGG